LGKSDYSRQRGQLFKQLICYLPMATNTSKNRKARVKITDVKKAGASGARKEEKKETPSRVGATAALSFDYFGAMRESWEKFREIDVLKWSAAVFGVVVLTVIMQLVGYVIIFASMKDGLSAFANSDNDLSLMIPRLAVDMFSAAVAGLLLFFIMPRLMGASMRAVGLKTAEQPSYINWIVLNARRFFLDLLCWYDRRLITPAAVLLVVASLSFGISIVVGMGSAAYLPLSILGMLSFMLFVFAWMIAVYVHSIRTEFGFYMYLRGDGKEGDMPKKSYDLVVGQTFEVFLARLGLGVLLMIGICAIAIPVVIVVVLLAVVPVVGILIDVILAIILYAALIIGLNAYDAVLNSVMFRFFEQRRKSM